MQLNINEDKTKYMPPKKNCRYSSTYLQINSYKFKTVDSFTYLGSEVNCENDNKTEIRKRIMLANKCFYGLRTRFKSHIISRKTKMLLYKVLIRPVVTYASETWVLTKEDENALSRFERKILRSIFGAINDRGQWRRRYNSELYELYKEPDLVKYIKINRLRWAGHVQRMEDIFNSCYRGK